MLDKKIRKFKLGLEITEELKRTPEEDTNDSALMVHTPSGVPDSWNYRKVGYKDYTTPIQDQGDCGSCVAFGSTAALEVTQKWADQNPGEDIKRSEADLFSNGGKCSSGWTLEAANAVLQSKGVCLEKCWPYNGSKQPCTDQTRLKIVSATRITSDSVAKEWLSTKGAIQAAMEVDSDFFDYSGGVYSPEYGDYAGGHCVCIIGYDDVEDCWICKNSWGLQWGDPNDPGWFKIAYGQCGIFRAYAGYGYTVATVPPIPPVADTGVHIDAKGIGADVVVDGTFLGKTDGDIALAPGHYLATIKKDGYVSQDITFDVINKQVTTLTVTLQPIAKADINLEMDGTLSIAPFGYANYKYDLMLNDADLGPVSKMKTYPKTNLKGNFKNGDALTFGLKDQKTGVVSHNTIVKVFGHDRNGIPNMWYAMMGVTLGIVGKPVLDKKETAIVRYNMNFIVRLMPVSKALAATKAAMDEAKTIEELEEVACRKDELEAACNKRQNKAINARLDAKVLEARKSKEV